MEEEVVGLKVILTQISLITLVPVSKKRERGDGRFEGKEV